MNFMDDIKEQLLKKEFEYDAVDAESRENGQECICYYWCA